MALSEAIEQWAPPGVHVLAAPEPALPLVRRIARGLYFRIIQIGTTVLIRRWARIFEANPRDYESVAAIRSWLHDPKAEMTARDDTAVRAQPPRAQDGHAADDAPIPADWFAPAQEKPRGVVFYVHGGSFVAERSPRVTTLVGRFAAAAKARVFAPNYRLAPEHPCPAAVEDIVAAWRWHCRRWPDTPVVALAESAGAAVLVAALHRIRDAGEQMPLGIVLLSPWGDVSLQSWSVFAASIARTTPMTMESLALMAHLYLQGQPAAARDASPLYGDFHGFPPFLIHACEGDILFDDATRLAEKVRSANGDLTVRVWTGEKHVWESMHSAKARQSVAYAAKFIRDRLDA